LSSAVLLFVYIQTAVSR